LTPDTLPTRYRDLTYLFLTLRNVGSNQADFEVFSKHDKSRYQTMTELRPVEIKKKLE
jgi:hypothetical protein